MDETIKNEIQGIKQKDLLMFMALTTREQGVIAVNMLSSWDNLMQVAENAKNPYVAKIAKRKLRAKFHPVYIGRHLWKLKIPIILLLIFFIATAFASDGFLPMWAIPIGQLNYVLLRWRFIEDNAWPGLIGYMGAPYLGILISGLAVYGLFKIMTDKNQKNTLMPARILQTLIISGLSFLGVFLIETWLFKDGLSIVGQGMPTSGVVMTSDVALQDFSLWGFFVYFIHTIEIVLFLSGSVFLMMTLFPKKFIHKNNKQ